MLGSNPVDPFARDDGDADLLFAQGASQSGKFGLQWKLRMMAQEAALEVANGTLRRRQDRNSVLPHVAVNRKCTPRWRGPAKSLDIDKMGQR